MKITSKREVKSYPLTIESIDILYPDTDENNNGYRDYLKKLITALKQDHSEIFRENNDFSCFIERRAYDAFNAFANEIYANSRNEACGVFMGYYFHNPENENQKIILATNFLEAHGPATRVTCEISFDDNIRYSNFAEAHKMLPVVWVHSHPGFGTFYSGTDSDTLSRCFRAPHQMGVVVDILQDLAMGFKIYNDKETNESFYLLDGDSTIANSTAVVECAYERMSLEKKNVENHESKKQPDSRRIQESANTVDDNTVGNVEEQISDNTDQADIDTETPILANAVITPKNSHERSIISMSGRIVKRISMMEHLSIWIVIALLGVISIELLVIILKIWK